MARTIELDLRAKLTGGQNIEEALRVVAPPGHREHLAIDIATLGDPEFDEDLEATPAFACLRVRAAAYGFHISYPRGTACGPAYDPGHRCQAGLSRLANSLKGSRPAGRPACRLRMDRKRVDLDHCFRRPPADTHPV